MGPIIPVQSMCRTVEKVCPSNEGIQIIENATMQHMEATLEFSGYKQKYGKVVSSGPQCMKTPENLFFWGIDFMGPFLRSHDCEYILVAVDYVSK